MTAFINLNVALLITTSCKSAVALVICEVGVNDDVGDFLRTAVARRL